ncbi:hypothetical protein TNCT_555301 [Trichonephila clavata]|uniref:Uncharacterized protein n=1 Tax=Trichonephila clavata TaxID=2740835 RepID=A0A8X6FTP5_TRICU|nr:hypothetical protein TNCT_555301 [Trichonephila clavata]
MTKFTVILALCLFCLTALEFSRAQEFYDPECDSGCPAGDMRNQFGECVSRALCGRPMSTDQDLVQESPCNPRRCMIFCRPRRGLCIRGRCVCR